MAPEDLTAMFEHLVDAPLECDGLSRIIWSDLTEAGHEPSLMVGNVSVWTRSFTPHMWVEVSGLIIDFRARLWLGNAPEVPHGVFCAEETIALYEGVEINAWIVPPGVREFMLMELPEGGSAHGVRD